jgi:ribosome production factor 2
MLLKRPNAISFSKKNVLRPFEDASSLEFWSNKNDASLFVVGLSTKKRPNGLVFVRMFDGKVLDMCEVGVDSFAGIHTFNVRSFLSSALGRSLRYNIQTPKSTPGHKPLLHFASPLFNTHPRFIHLKTLLMAFFNGEVVDSICLPGLDHVISISLGPTPEGLNTTGEEVGADTDSKNLPKVHIRAYTVKFLASSTRIPQVALDPMGPFLDLSMRRQTLPDPEMLKQALRQPKLKKKDVEKGLGKKRKNLEVDEMGDLRGRIHVGKQDLEGLKGLKGKKMKALRGQRRGGGWDADDAHEGDVEDRS